MSTSFAKELNRVINEIFIHGFFKDNESDLDSSLFAIIPDSIIFFIAELLGPGIASSRYKAIWNQMVMQNVQHDAWDTSTAALHCSYSTDMNNRYILKRANDCEINPYSFGTRTLSIQTAEKMLWKIRILYPRLQYVGIVKEPVSRQSSWCHMDKASYILSTKDGVLWTRGKWKQAEKRYIVGQHINEVVYVLLDAQKKTLSVMINGKFRCLFANISKLERYRFAIGTAANAKVELLASFAMK